MVDDHSFNLLKILEAMKSLEDYTYEDIQKCIKNLNRIHLLEGKIDEYQGIISRLQNENNTIRRDYVDLKNHYQEIKGRCDNLEKENWYMNDIKKTYMEESSIQNKVLEKMMIFLANLYRMANRGQLSSELLSEMIGNLKDELEQEGVSLLFHDQGDLATDVGLQDNVRTDNPALNDIIDYSSKFGLRFEKFYDRVSISEKVRVFKYDCLDVNGHDSDCIGTGNVTVAEERGSPDAVLNEQVGSCDDVGDAECNPKYYVSSFNKKRRTRKFDKYYIRGPRDSNSPFTAMMIIGYEDKGKYFEANERPCSLYEALRDLLNENKNGLEIDKIADKFKTEYRGKNIAKNNKKDVIKQELEMHLSEFELQGGIWRLKDDKCWKGN